MARSPRQNSNDTFVDNWVEIGALIPMSPRAPPPTSRVQRRRHSKMGTSKRRYVPSKTMVIAAIKTLMRNPRTGVSFFAIKKFITENYRDTFSDKTNRFHFVKRFIKRSLEKGDLIRTKGIGVSGSFRLPYTQKILKGKAKKTYKKKPKRTMSKTKQLKEVPKPLKEKASRQKVTKNNVESVTGGGGDGGGDADEVLSIGREKIAKTISKASVRKLRKTSEANS